MSTGPIVRPSPVKRWIVVGVVGFGVLFGAGAVVAHFNPEPADPQCGFTSFRNALWREGYAPSFGAKYEDVRCADRYGYMRRNPEGHGRTLDALFIYRSGRWRVLAVADADQPIPNDIPADVLARILPPGHAN